MVLLAATGLIAAKIYFAVIKIDVTDKSVPVLTINDVPRECWQKLATKKILFGHQGVGNNIIGGLKQIETEYDFINLHIIEVNDVALVPGRFFFTLRSANVPMPFQK